MMCEQTQTGTISEGGGVGGERGTWRGVEYEKEINT